eukprot:TRINITY_DN2548_c0_g1_i1.p1 TRINITY_DN2548_c0_g1~~TRINITY_DN2548_c0_g1_i1.p1  ORF type:complete len:384 (+),score=137.62 TRINITY_DN2548_c0_g1_i1:87-1238(+)
MQENERLHLLGFGERQQAPLWKIVLIVIGGTMMTIVCGGTNAFSVAYGSQLQSDLQIDDNKRNVLSGLALLGLYFVLPSGYILQKFGPFALGAGSLVLASVGYGLLPFATPHTYPLAFILLCLIGFGLGGVFMAALGVSISISPTGGGWTMAVVSSGMSLSVAFHLYILQVYKDKTQCYLDECWRSYVRFYMIVLVALASAGVSILYLYKKSDYPHLRDSESPSAKSIQEEDDFEPLKQNESREAKQDGLLQSFKAFKSPFFLSLFLGFFVGIGSSVFILTLGFDIWKDYLAAKGVTTQPSIGPYLITMFSFFNAGSNILTGILSDWLASRSILRYSSFLAIFQFFFSLVFVVIGILLHYVAYTSFFAVLVAFVGTEISFSML